VNTISSAVRMPSTLSNRRSHVGRGERQAAAHFVDATSFCSVAGLSVGGLPGSRSPIPSSTGLAGYGVAEDLSATSPQAKKKRQSTERK
jgi:hypothetical protein